MTSQPLESRVENLEQRVTNVEENLGPGDPGELPVLPLRTEMRNGFSALRADVAQLRGVIGEQGTQMRVLYEDVIGRIALIQEGLPGQLDGKRGGS